MAAACNIQKVGNAYLVLDDNGDVSELYNGLLEFSGNHESALRLFI